MEGDELVITVLSRLSRTQREVINRLHDLLKQGIHAPTLDGLVNTKALVRMSPVMTGLLLGLYEVEHEMTRHSVMETINY